MPDKYSPGDVVISKVNGPAEAYVIGVLEPATDGGGLRFRYVDSDANRDSALSKAEKHERPDGRIWPFLD